MHPDLIYIYIYAYKKVESFDSRRILRDTSWIKNKEGERVKVEWMDGLYRIFTFLVRFTFQMT